MFRKIIIFILALFLAAPVTLADDSSIIPVLWLFAINGNLDWQDWKDKLKNTYAIYQYNGSTTVGTPVKVFEIFGGDIYQYDGSNTVGTPVKAFEIFGDDIYQYDGSSTVGTPVKAFEIFGGDIYQYDGSNTVGTPVKAFELR